MKNRLEVKCLWLPKAGNSESEYEDAYAYRSHRTMKRETHFAVADGATETSFSGIWAKILTKTFVDNRLRNINQETIIPLVSEWEQEIARRTVKSPLAWYAEEKLKQGAFSSLLGLTINPEENWSCGYVGDSCLFHIRSGEILQALPYEHASEFHNHPALISTDVAHNDALNIVWRSGDWAYGDYFLLMTDALAQCFLSDKATLTFFTRVRTQERFRQKVETLKAQNQCRNDDITLMRVHITPPITL